MNATEKAAIDKLVEQFQAIKDPTEKCRFFHKAENAALKTIFREHFFPNPDADATGAAGSLSVAGGAATT